MPAEILPAFFRKKPRCWQKFQHIVKGKVISESEENSNDKQKYCKRNKENEKKLHGKAELDAAGFIRVEENDKRTNIKNS